MKYELRYIITLMKDTPEGIKPLVFVRTIDETIDVSSLLIKECEEHDVPYQLVTGTSGKEGYKSIRLLSSRNVE